VLQFLVRLCLSVARFIYKNKQERKKQNKTKKMILCMALGNWQKFVETETETEVKREKKVIYIHTYIHRNIAERLEVVNCVCFYLLTLIFFLN